MRGEPTLPRFGDCSQTPVPYHVGSRPMRMLPSRALIVAILGASSSCAPQSLPARGEVVVVVDTDLSVPEHASEFRLDLYSLSGEWHASRSIVLPSVQDWPPSFSLYSPDGEAEALVRLRVYPRGVMRDYLGERFMSRSLDGSPTDLAPEPESNGEPRLIVDGVDVTPDQEPHPLVTIDRLLLLRFVPGEVGGHRVVLRGVCAGTMADITSRTSCVDRPDQHRPVEVESLQSVEEASGSVSLAGQFAAPIPCTATPRVRSKAPGGTELFDEEVCVAGGAFHLGSADDFGDSSYPMRLVHVRPFLMDKYEVTVGRWRDAIRRGFEPSHGRYVVNDGPSSPSIKDSTGCTYTSATGEREVFPMSCLTHDQARAFCQFNGGDLPTEAQWEWAATAAGRQFKTQFPWGNEPADCTSAVFARDDTAGMLGECSESGLGAQPVYASDHDPGDRTPEAGVVGLAGGVSEFTRDMYAAFASNCWMSTPVDDPLCDDSSSSKPAHTARGGSWAHDHPSVTERVEQGYDNIGTFIGFRCVRPGGP